VNPHQHLRWDEVTVALASVANVCLMLVAAFYRESARSGTTNSPWRVRSGYVAVTTGLCSQLIYCSMLGILWFGWVPFDPGVNSVTNLETKFANAGSMLSVATVLVALFGTGLRRYAGIWVGGTTFFFWSIVGLGAALKSLFR
jgi:hypothetical protein